MFKAISFDSFASSAKHVTIAAALLMSGPAAQAVASPFANLGGSWSGSGVITLSSGATEKIRCRATYTVDRNDENLSIVLRCASEAYNFNLTSSISHSNGAVTGVWSESTFAVGGTITGRGTLGSIQVRAEGMIVNAMLAVTTRADRQSVSITSPGSPLSDVAINLTRGKSAAAAQPRG